MAGLTRDESMRLVDVCAQLIDMNQKQADKIMELKSRYDVCTKQDNQWHSTVSLPNETLRVNMGLLGALLRK